MFRIKHAKNGQTHGGTVELMIHVFNANGSVVFVAATGTPNATVPPPPPVERAVPMRGFLSSISGAAA